MHTEMSIIAAAASSVEILPDKESEIQLVHKALLRLFNCVQIAERSDQVNIDEHIQKRTLQNGYVLDGTFQPDHSLLDVIESQIGLSGEKANSSFHKSWQKVLTADLATLALEQLVHYFTTYDAKRLGLYSKETVFIPAEVLKVPDVTDNIPMVVIRGCTPIEILGKIKTLGSMGIALADKTLEDIMTIVKFHNYDPDYLDEISNRELLALLRDWYNIVPTKPLEFLRHLIVKLTGSSLIIKNKELIDRIKAADAKILDSLIVKAPKDLASIFLRFKSLFLAMKSIATNKAFFNRLRKDANHLHKPLAPENLNSVTNRIKRGTLNLDHLGKWLESATVFRKARLAYALHNRTMDRDSILYQIRNGTGWATSFAWTHHEQAQEALNVVLASIVRGLEQAVAEKIIYIPVGVGYAMPATEKQFLGNFPCGTYVEVPDNMIVGIHWNNVKERMTDLDLSGLSQEGKIGWDGAIRRLDEVAAFSGDITDAPHGASEQFWFTDSASPHLINVNYYNYDKNFPVPARVFVARDQPRSFGSDYTVDPNNIIAVTNVEFSRSQCAIGLVSSVEGRNRFYFTNVSTGKYASASNNVHARRSREFLVQSALSPLLFNTMLEAAGARIVTEKPVGGDFIDLSPNALDRMTIINLLKGVCELVMQSAPPKPMEADGAPLKQMAIPENSSDRTMD